MAVVLESQLLRFGYGARTIGRNVSFALGAGDVLAVLGPNGGGKTTLFRTLLGLLPAQAGSIRLEGRALNSYERGALARVAGYVPQGHASQFAYSVREIVLMGRTAHLAPYAVPGSRDREAADRAIAALALTALADRPYTELSGGERQLVLIARALAQGPRLLVLDEPTAGLDFGNQLRVLDEISTLARRGIAVVFSTHDPDQAFLCAQRVLLLSQGHEPIVGTPNDTITADNLRELYGVEVEVKEFSVGNWQHRVCVPALR
ncbi:MAG: ABC transporter ATP-binding protein [Betaproteobacteria bacterium]|nr:ABC transporter ATP-binding protein [Betaproteobacteria bacterium]